ncbi:carboxypeptidase regulatory-like domain-containing protein [Candidatus Woesearchaeota archaeon]|nr:carboxypeptidase regulatory-like domain-containing protein [Candidatus Woesearchaeota archaeon]
MRKKVLSLIVLLAFSFILFIPFISATTILKGIVLDKDGAVVGKAALKFDCNDNNINYPKTTDNFGTFRIENAAIGECELFAQAAGFTGSTIIQVQQDATTKAVITLNTPLVNTKSTIALLIIILMFAIILFAVFYWLHKLIRKKIKFKKEQTQQQDQQSKQKPQKQELSDKLNTIYPTLSKNEKAIIDYMKNNNNQAVQAALRHATDIARTTLTRTLQSLEQKKLIIIEKHGKAVKIKFSDWINE